MNSFKVESVVLNEYFLKLAELFSRDGISFLASCQNLLPRPWVIDDLESFIQNGAENHGKRLVVVNHM